MMKPLEGWLKRIIEESSIRQDLDRLVRKLTHQQKKKLIKQLQGKAWQTQKIQ